jgi:NitT/TauT family transport system substrate-binding protein
MRLQAIYAILQRDASAIVSTKLDNIAKLGEGTYGSYNAKYEDHIVKAMVTSAGGRGEGMQIKNSTGKFSLFEELKNGALDEAKLDSVKIHPFKPEEYGVPYGYSPVIARDVGPRWMKRHFGSLLPPL